MIKKAIICMITFSIVCILVTCGLIYYKNNQAIKEEWHNEATKSTKSGIDLEGYYDQNDLILINNDITYQDATCTVKLISGLKDKKIQDKINKKITDEFYDLTENLIVIHRLTFICMLKVTFKIFFHYA